MNVFSNYVEKERWEKSLSDLSHLDFTLFYDYKPNQYEINLSPINIFIACEPNEYFGNHDFTIHNNGAFNVTPGSCVVVSIICLTTSAAS